MLTESEKVDLLVQYLSECLRTSRLAGVGPTRSGRQVQARISFEKLPGVRCIRCVTVTTGTVNTWLSGPCDFTFFCEMAFDPIGVGKGSSRREGREIYKLALTEIKNRGFEQSSEPLRQSVADRMRECIAGGLAKKQMLKHEIGIARKGLRSWMDQAVKLGLEKSDIETLFDEALVKNVLES